MTISAALRPCSSSLWMAVGMPRPLSVTEMLLSAWMVTTMSSQYPANASSMALSTTSKTMWCRPVPSDVSPIYMPGRLRTASRPLSILMDSAPYSGTAGLRVCSDIVFRGEGRGLGRLPVGHDHVEPWSDTHRHDDILELVVVGRGEERGGVDVRLHRPADRLGLDVGQHVQQVADVEADIQRLVAVVDVDFLNGFFLFGVRGRNAQQVFRQLDPHALELVGGENGSALQAALERLAIDEEVARVLRGDHAGEVGELALDQLGDQLDVAEAEAD